MTVAMRQKWLLRVMLVFAGYVLGVFSYRSDWPPISTYRLIRDPQPLGYYADIRGKTQVPCPPSGDRTIVLLALGQSNASNRRLTGEPHLNPAPAAVNFFEGACYLASDPLLGADGDGSSVWTLVGHRLAVDTDKNVVVAPFTANGTTVHQWSDNWFLKRRLARIITSLGAASLTPTAVAWFQGESDATLRTSEDDYVAYFLKLYKFIRENGVAAPVYVSASTVCQGFPNETVRRAQRKLTSIDSGILRGPDTDTLGFGYRWDGCHFTAEGRAAAAQLWAQVLLNSASR